MLPLRPSRWLALPADLHQRIAPTPLPDPVLAAWNPRVALDLGLPATLDEARPFTELLAGNAVPAETTPLATGYAGHQFGTWVPELGDGRAILLGDLVAPHHQPWELQLKGSGRTRWSRMGDGRAVLRSTVREFLASAAMEGLGVPTTRALAIVTSPEPVYREREETAAVLTRLAPSLARFGHVEWLASRGDEATLRTLVDHVIDHHYPSLLARPLAERHAAWLEAVVTRTARLMAQWTAVGFAHGVMNTDNFSLLGLTLDYGPFGWMERYEPGFICNHTDHGGRYAFDQQPRVGLWNCVRLAEALHALVDETTAIATLERYRATYEETIAAAMHAKLGLATQHLDDIELVAEWFALLERTGADFTRAFRALSAWVPGDVDALRTEIPDHAGLDAWLVRYADRIAHEPRGHAERHAAMRAVNPAYVLRNWVAQEVIVAAEGGDFTPLATLLDVLARPFDAHPEAERWGHPPARDAKPVVVSCSS
jgi:serine/tyrosine/threonine adenylyltransferase